MKPNARYYTILAISDELLRITSMERQNVEGRSIFELYPENPDTVSATGPAKLKAFLQNAVTLRQEGQMPTIRYNLSTAEGSFVERYWSAGSKPVLNPEGEVLYNFCHREPLIQAAGAQLEVDVADCPSIRFSEKNLRSVIYNLLSNAIKYRDPGRECRVQIHCERANEYDVLTVKDNGLGMAERRLAQLFTMFKRFHTHVEGTGIGLYKVKKIIENAGGHIKVESQAGEGSTFRVYFPC